MIEKIRFIVKLLIPTSFKYYLMRKLPDLVNLIARFFQGMDFVWEQDKEFISLHSKISNKMLIDKKKSFILYNLVKNISHLEGNLAEFGVFRGGSSLITIEANQRKKPIYLFDTFEGLPQVHDGNDAYWKHGEMSETSVEFVQSFLNYPKAEYFKGFFPDSAKSIKSDEKYCFVHIDVDIYQSMLDGCLYFYEKVVPGGVMLFDDYGDLSCPGAKKAIDMFFSKMPEIPIALGCGQAIIIKQ